MTKPDKAKPHEAPSRVSQRNTALLQLHMAEYQALTTRETYWLTLQFAVWPIVVFVVSLAPQFRGMFSRATIYWGTAVIVQVGVLNWYHVVFEIYTAVTYLESKLRPQVEALVGETDFWFYERYQKSLRGRGPKWWELWPAIACALGVALLFVDSHEWDRTDWLGATTNVVLLIWICMKSVRSVRMRMAFFGTEHAPVTGGSPSGQRLLT